MVKFYQFKSRGYTLNAWAAYDVFLIAFLAAVLGGERQRGLTPGRCRFWVELGRAFLVQVLAWWSTEVSSLGLTGCCCHKTGLKKECKRLTPPANLKALVCIDSVQSPKRTFKKSEETRKDYMSKQPKKSQYAAIVGGGVKTRHLSEHPA